MTCWNCEFAGTKEPAFAWNFWQSLKWIWKTACVWIWVWQFWDIWKWTLRRCLTSKGHLTSHGQLCNCTLHSLSVVQVSSPFCLLWCLEITISNQMSKKSESLQTNMTFKRMKKSWEAWLGYVCAYSILITLVALVTDSGRLLTALILHLYCWPWKQTFWLCYPESWNLRLVADRTSPRHWNNGVCNYNRISEFANFQTIVRFKQSAIRTYKSDTIISYDINFDLHLKASPSTPFLSCQKSEMTSILSSEAPIVSF